MQGTNPQNNEKIAENPSMVEIISLNDFILLNSNLYLYLLYVYRICEEEDKIVTLVKPLTGSESQPKRSC